jgi:putative transposase
MARLPRLAIAGALHHLMLRGHDGQLLARDTDDRVLLLSVLREAAVGQGVAIHAYALLDHELHLLCTPAEASGLGRMVQALGRRYVAAFNRRHGRRGSLWEGRFRCSVVAPDLLHGATVHVESLPVEAGLVSNAAEWPWSSAPHHTGARRDPVVAEHVGYWTLGNTPFERESAHAHMLSQGVPVVLRQRLADAVRRGHATGSADFVQHVAELAKRPVQARRRGRPRRIET